ncbi:MAG: penicillin-binding protein 2 [Candidatus Krumholzibacteriota bacterium]|nr:penicillin-binding protein 2 [Candidatus Krumholzibacteriota bacterium]
MADFDRQSEFYFNHRKRILLILVIGVTSILLSRLFYLQVIRKDYYSKLAISNRIQRERIVAPRGVIKSSDGSKLVVNVPVYQISVVPGKLAGKEERLRLACDWLDIDEEKMFLNLVEWTERYPDGREMTVVQAAQKSQISILMENRAFFPFFKLVMKHRRQYPEGDLASHLLGYVGEVTDEELKGEERFSVGDITGRTGIEFMYEEYLRGEDGVRIVEISAEGIRVGEYDMIEEDEVFEGFVQSRPPVPGCDLILTIDLDLQKAIEEAFDWDKGCVMAMDPETGAVLAAVSRPGYDPNIFMGGISADDWNELFADPDKPLFNRIVQATYPPASTFKLISAYAGLNFERVSRTERFEPCYGGYQFGNRYFRCWKPEGHGSSALFDAIVNSCDVYFYQLGERTEADEFAYAGRLFGLGRKTGIDLPSEARGTLPDHSYFDRRFGKRKWTKGHLLNLSIGQGEVLATPVQLCQMVAMIANNGERIQPHVVDRVVDSEGATVFGNDRSSITIPQIDQKILDFIQNAMEDVVTGESGTGRACAISGIRIAGKTGTAQNSGNDHALFVAYAPVENPEIAIAIVMENAGHGGAVAAPMARKIFSAYFNPHISSRGDARQDDVRPASGKPDGEGRRMARTDTDRLDRAGR